MIEGGWSLQPWGKMMDEKRRNKEKELSSVLKRQLNEEQRFTLGDLERFGWESK